MRETLNRVGTERPERSIATSSRSMSAGSPVSALRNSVSISAVDSPEFRNSGSPDRPDGDRRSDRRGRRCKAPRGPTPRRSAWAARSRASPRPSSEATRASFPARPSRRTASAALEAAVRSRLHQQETSRSGDPPGFGRPCSDPANAACLPVDGVLVELDAKSSDRDIEASPGRLWVPALDKIPRRETCGAGLRESRLFVGSNHRIYTVHGEDRVNVRYRT